MMGRRIACTLPLGQKESYSYDAGGNLRAKTDFNGRTTSYAYDVNNRLLSRTPDAFFNAPPVSFTYNALGLRLSMSDGSGTTTYTISAHGTVSSTGVTVEGGVDFLYQISTHRWFAALTGGFGTNPLGAFAVGRGAGGAVSFGVVMNMVSPQDMSGLSVSAVWPLSVLHLFSPALFNSNKAWGLLTQLAKNVHNVDLIRHAAVGFGLSSSGSPFATLALRSNAFGSYFYDSTNFYPISASGLDSFLNDSQQTFGGLMSVAESITDANSFAQSGDAILGALNAVQ